MNYVMVLNDGETYSAVQGCSIIAIPDEVDYDEYEDFIGDALRENTPAVVTRFGAYLL